MDKATWNMLRGGAKGEKARTATTADLRKAVKQGMREALAEVFAEPEPTRPDATRRTAAELERDYPGTAHLWRDDTPPLPPRPGAPNAEQLQRRAQQIEDNAIDLRTATPAQAERRLRQLGVDGVLLSDLALRPVTKAPPPVRHNDVSRESARWEQAKLQLRAAKRIAKVYGAPIDVGDLTPDAYALYLREKGLDPLAPTLGSGALPTRDGGK